MDIKNNEFMPENNPIKFPAPEAEVHNNRRVIKTLYKALDSGEKQIVAKLVACDHLEWWFHGPSCCNHMMRLLTGESTTIDFKFRPRRIKAVGDRVIVEGWEGSKAYWVHVWTLKDGMIIQFREYFDTWLTVIRRASEDGVSIKLWQSGGQELLHCSFPDLVLAI